MQSLCSMTPEETIKKLDKLIKQLNGCILQNLDIGFIKNYVIKELNNIAVSLSTINTIDGISIKDYYRNNDLARQYYGTKEYKKMAQEEYKATIESMIRILQQEREAQVQAKQDEAQKLAFEEQKKGNAIQHRAYWCSIIATIISLIALIVAVCK